MAKRHVADRASGPDTTLDVLAQLRPGVQGGGRITAGNSSQVSDGAAAVLLDVGPPKARALGLTRTRAEIDGPGRCQKSTP